MLWAKYVGAGNFSERPWDGALQWHCDAYWPDEYSHHPSILIVTLRAQHARASVQDARLELVDGLPGSRPSFTQDSGKVSITLRYDGFPGNEVVLSGEWRKKSHTGPIKEVFTLQGVCVDKGKKPPPPLQKDASEAKCNVQYLAILLEPLLERLSDGETLSLSETKNLQGLIADYVDGDCGTQQCRPGSCALRQQHDWLTFHGYKDLRDVLDFEHSGLNIDPPKLHRRPGVETLKLTSLKRPGHYNP